MSQFKYSEAKEIILAELNASLSAVEDAQVEKAVEMLTGARKVFVVGVGRVLLMLQAFVKRLNHLGIEAYFVGEINEPAITPDDVLLVASGSGESAIPVVISRVAQKYNPKLLYVGSNMQSTVASMADHCVRIPCKTKLNLPDELSSQQPMSSLFEQSILLAFDSMAFMIARNKNIVIKDLWQKHANLE